MGFLDSLAKLGKELEKSEAFQDVKKGITDSVNSISQMESVSKTIPEKYVDFPKFNGTISNLNEKNTSNYERCTIDYNNIAVEDLSTFIDQVTTAGYDKKTSVRYEKDSTYIIIEAKGNNLHIVYHIKK